MLCGCRSELDQMSAIPTACVVRDLLEGMYLSLTACISQFAVQGTAMVDTNVRARLRIAVFCSPMRSPGIITVLRVKSQSGTSSGAMLGLHSGCVAIKMEAEPVRLLYTVI